MRNAKLQSVFVRRAILTLPLSLPHSALGAPTNLIRLLQSHQHVARLRSVGGSQDPCHLQLVDYPRRSPVPDTHTPLQQRGRAELVLDADFRGLPEQRIALPRSALLALPASVFPCFLRFFQRRHLFIDARARGGRRL